MFCVWCAGHLSAPQSRQGPNTAGFLSAAGLPSACIRLAHMLHGRPQALLLDLCAAYKALRAGAEPELPPVRLQYPDFAAWQQRRAASSAVARQARRRALCCHGVASCRMALLPGPLGDPGGLAAPR